MKNRKMLLQVLLSMALVLSLIVPASVLNTAFVMAQGSVTPMVAAGFLHTVGLESDGTVVAAGDNDYGQCDVGGWTDIAQVAAGEYHTVGVKSDGTVVAVGCWVRDNYGQCDVGGWTDIVHIAAGYRHTVGLEFDGTAVAVGWNDDGQCDVGNWTDITQVAAGHSHTVGLKSDGTVVAVGYNGSGRCDVGGWTNITHVSAGDRYTVGLKPDGTVVAVGDNSWGQCDVGGWTDITQVAAGGWHTVGLKSDSTVLAVGDNVHHECDVSGWTDITRVAAGSSHTLGLKSDGTVVAVGKNGEGQCDVGGWNLVPAVSPPQEVKVGVKAGEWIKFEYKISGWPAGIPRPEWVQLEFLSVEGTTANVQTTTRWSDGTEGSDTVLVDLGVGGGEILGPAGSIISANLTTGDSVYIAGFGDVAIDGETTRTYAGARRTVVYASISQDEAQYTYHWDKLTGVMVEVSVLTATIKATETNMWAATTAGMPGWPWIIVAVVAVGLVIFFMRRRVKGQADTSG